MSPSFVAFFFHLANSLSYRKFVGLSLPDETPDATTFVNSRKRPGEANIVETVFGAVVAHIEPQGLRARGVTESIIDKRNRGQAQLSGWQERWSRLASWLRARVEHPIAMMKEQLGCRCVRYRGRKRNEFDYALTLEACNLKKSLSLKPVSRVNLDRASNG